MTAANNDASPMDGAPVIDFDKFKPTRSFTSARKRKDFAMKALIRNSGGYLQGTTRFCTVTNHSCQIGNHVLNSESNLIVVSSH